MDSKDVISFTLFVGCIGFLCFFILNYIVKVLRRNIDEDHQEAKRKERQQNAGDSKTTNQIGGKQQQSTKKKPKTTWASKNDNKQSFSHLWLLTSLKGHSGQILDMDLSANGKYLVSCADDRTVMVWDIKDLHQLSHKSLRINVEFDHATSSKFSPDSKAVIINKCDANAIEIYKLEKKKDAWLSNGHKSITFSKVHDSEVINIGISCNGKFIMSSSNKSDVVIFDLKGQKLGTINSKFDQNYSVKISPCGRFVAISGSATDVLIYEINFAMTGEFQNIKEAFKLKHSAEVYDIAFDADTSHIATVSRDGKWYMFHTKISYKHGDLPQLIKQGVYTENTENLHHPSRIALTPNAEVVAVASGNSVSFYATHECHLDCQIDGLVTDDDWITSVAFDSDGTHLFVGGGRFVRVFHNVTGYRCGIETAKEKLKQNQTSATRERLKQLIVDFEKTIKSIEV